MRADGAVSTELLLSELRKLDIRLFVEGYQLRCSAPKGRLTKELAQRIAANKPDLIDSPPLGPGQQHASVFCPGAFLVLTES